MRLMEIDGCLIGRRGVLVKMGSVGLEGLWFLGICGIVGFRVFAG